MSIALDKSCPIKSWRCIARREAIQGVLAVTCQCATHYISNLSTECFVRHASCSITLAGKGRKLGDFPDPAATRIERG